MELQGKMGNRNNFAVSPRSLRETSVLMISSIHPTRLFGGSSFGATRHTGYHPGLPVKSRANGKLSCSKASVIYNDVDLNNFCIYVYIIVHRCMHCMNIDTATYLLTSVNILQEPNLITRHHCFETGWSYSGKWTLAQKEKHMLLGWSADPRLNKPETVGHKILHQLEWLRYCKSQAINRRRRLRVCLSIRLVQ